MDDFIESQPRFLELLHSVNEGQLPYLGDSPPLEGERGPMQREKGATRKGARASYEPVRLVNFVLPSQSQDGWSPKMAAKNTKIFSFQLHWLPAAINENGLMLSD